MATYDYNTGKELLPGQAQSSFNSQTGQPIGPITSASLAPTAPIQLPPAPTLTDPTPHIANGMAVIGANAATLTPPTDPNPTDTSSSNLFSNYFKQFAPPPSSTDQYNQDFAASGIPQAQNDVNAKAAVVKAAQSKLAATTAQIAGITAQAQQRNLAAEGQGGLVGQLSGIQAENNRKAAIQALPLQVQALANQAEVASAQGDQQLSQSILEQAKTHLDTLFQIHEQDAQAQYQYRNKVIDAVYNFADKQQQAKLDAQRTANAQAYQTQRDTIAYNREVEKAKLDEQLKQSDPLYRAQLAKTYADIASSQSNQTLNGKPQTAVQSQVQGYADRTNSADIILTKLGSQFASTSLGNILGSKNPTNFFKSSDRQQYEQAQRNFVNAVLRRESGAAISQSEFDNRGTALRSSNRKQKTANR
jgi:hypothetical protein